MSFLTHFTPLQHRCVRALAAADAFIKKSLESALVQTLSEMANALLISTQQSEA